jgi:hypothetical protein
MLRNLACGWSSTHLDWWTRLVVATCLLLGFAHALLVLPASAADADVAFSISKGVSGEDVSYVKEGIVLARDYVAETLAGSAGRLAVNVRGTEDTTGSNAVAFSGGSYIVIFTGSPGWTALAPFDRVRVVVHEYVHSYQHAALQEDVATLPAWFLEGMADYLSYDAVAGLGAIDSQVVRDYHAWSVSSSGAMPALADLHQRDAFYGEHGPVYSLAYLAIDTLMRGQSSAELVQLFDAIRHGQSWRRAFTEVFDQGPEVFYREFEQARRDLIAPVRVPEPFRFATPAAIEAAVAINEIASPVAAGEQLAVVGRSEAGAICELRLSAADSSETITGTTFADESGRLFWLVTIPSTSDSGSATLTADCGAEPDQVNLQIAGEGAGEPQEEAA